MDNLILAKTFLSSFNHQKFTLAYLSPKGMRSFPCVPNKIQTALDYLKKENSKDADIYFMVNEGSGEWNDPENKIACHSTKNVIKLSAIFLDAELPNNVDPLPNIQQFCSDHFYIPSLIVESSPQRYHCYWLLEHSDLSKQSIVRWKQIQALLHSELSSDRTMTDIPQILRVPGFKNLKKDWPVTLIERNDVRYSLDELYQKLLSSFPKIKELKAYEPLKTITEDYKVKEGERHEELLRRARKLYSIESLSDADIKCFMDGFISNHLAEPKDFLPTGKRRLEIDRILEAAKTYRENEKKEEQLEKVTKALTRSQKNKSQFALDEDFFYQAPGLVGDITRYIVDTSDYPLPAHAFAAAASLVGFTKARFIQGEKQLPPLNYFLCLAPSGSGKTSIQTTIKNILSSLQISHLLEDGIASAQGLISFLSNSNGLGFVMYDEVKELFQTLSSKNSYEFKIASELTKLYTAYGSYYTPPTTKTHKGKKIVLSKPLFSFLGYGHFTLIESILKKEAILEGLVPRFIILNIEERKYVPKVSKLLPSIITDQLRKYVLKSCIAIEDKADTANLPVDAKPTTSIIGLSTEAQTIHDKFKESANDLYSQAIHDKNGLEAMFSRGAEQTIRLALSIENSGIITAKDMSFCTTLISNQMQEFYQTFNKTINQTEYSKDTERLYQKIVDLCANSSESVVVKRDVQNQTARWFKAKGVFQNQLAELMEQGKIIEYQVKMPSGKTRTMIKLGEDTLV